ncbi:MAG: hypothetical protein AAGF81_13545 [Pseudomonadota bacterium]
MSISRRKVVTGAITTAAVAPALVAGASQAHAGKAGADADSHALLMRVVRVMYPHARFPDGPYKRTTDAIVEASNKTLEQTKVLADGLQALKAKSFGDLDDAKATEHLKSIETTPFFGQVRGTAVVALYNDKEVWSLLGYEGPSYDKGGYIKRGYNDLDWLPEPRITEI